MQRHFIAIFLFHCIDNKFGNGRNYINSGNIFIHYFGRKIHDFYPIDLQLLYYSYFNKEAEEERSYFKFPSLQHCLVCSRPHHEPFLNKTQFIFDSPIVHVI